MSSDGRRRAPLSTILAGQPLSAQVADARGTVYGSEGWGLSRDIVHVCLKSRFAFSGLGLVVAGWVEGEFADELPVVLGADPQLQVAGEDEDLVPAQRRPMPMWWSRLLWRRVSLPSVSTRSRRTRKCSLMRMPWRAGAARG